MIKLPPKGEDALQQLDLEDEQPLDRAPYQRRETVIGATFRALAGQTKLLFDKLGPDVQHWRARDLRLVDQLLDHGLLRLPKPQYRWGRGGYPRYPELEIPVDDARRVREQWERKQAEPTPGLTCDVVAAERHLRRDADYCLSAYAFHPYAELWRLQEGEQLSALMKLYTLAHRIRDKRLEGKI